MLFTELCRDSPCRFANDFEPPDDRILQSCFRQEVILFDALDVGLRQSGGRYDIQNVLPVTIHI